MTQSPLPQKGFSTLELMVALMIMSATLTAVALVTLAVPSALLEGRTEAFAIHQATMLLNENFAMGLTSFSSVKSIATSTFNSVDTSLIVTLSPDGLTKQLTSTASWTDALKRKRYISLSALLTDFASASATTCSNILSGDWQHPSVTSYPFTTHPIQVSATDSVATSSLLVAAVTNSLAATDPTLFLFDISSTTHPTYLSSIDNASSTKMGLSAIAVHDHFIYAANSNLADFNSCTAGTACSQLQIIDATNSLTPAIIKNIKLAATTSPYVTGIRGQGSGKSIFYANGFIYLGLMKISNAINPGDEFNIIDVRNPNAPQWLGGYAVGRTVNQIRVKGNYAYLATDDSSQELAILDIHDPTHPTLVVNYDAPGPSGFAVGESLAVNNSTPNSFTILGRSYGRLVDPELLFINTNSLTAPVVVSSTSVSTTSDLTSADGIILRGFLAFILTNTSLKILNLADVTNPTPFINPISLPNSSNVTSSPSALSCRDNALYVASGDGTNGYLSVFTGS